MIEREFKFTLAAQDYQKLLKALPARAAETQTNYFFDTADRALRSERVALRLRTTAGKPKALLTVKEPSSEKVVVRGLKIRTEHETSLALPQAKSLIRNPNLIWKNRSKPAQRLRALFPDSPKLVRLGSFKNHRTTVRHANLTWELDRTKILEKTFYELEVETENPRAALKKIEAFKEEFSLNWEPSSHTKYSLFLKLYHL